MISDEQWDACKQPDDEPIEGVVVEHPIPSPPIFGFDPGTPGGQIFMTNGFYIAPVGTKPGEDGWTRVGEVLDVDL